MKKIIMAACAATMLMGCANQEVETNPFLSEYDTPFGVPPFVPTIISRLSSPL